MAGADRSTVLPLVEELERRDAQLADELAAVAALSARVSSIRARAGEAGETLERAPAELERVERLLAETQEALREAHPQLEAAETAVTRSPASEEAQDAARQARDRVGMLEERQAQLTALRDGIEGSRASAEAVQRQLVEEARTVTAEIASSPRLATASLTAPGDRPEVHSDWTDAVGAALLLARGTLEEERVRVVRETAELATAALGEPVGLGSVAALRQRLERELA